MLVGQIQVTIMLLLHTCSSKCDIPFAVPIINPSLYKDDIRQDQHSTPTAQDPVATV